MSQAAAQEEDFSVCGHCGQKDCRECFPWPDEEAPEITALREENLVLKSTVDGIDAFLEVKNNEISRLNALVSKLMNGAPRTSNVDPNEEVLKENAKLKEDLKAANTRIQIFVDGHQMFKEEIERLENQILQMSR